MAQVRGSASAPHPPADGGGRRPELTQDAVLQPQSVEREAEGQDELDVLAARTASGDRLAFELIYQQTVGDVYRYIASQTRISTHAEDLTANVFLKAWTHARSYRVGSRKYRHWLFAIARNEARDAWRRQQRTWFSQPLGDVDAAEESSAQPPDESAVVLKALAKLNEEQRQVVILKFYAGRSHSEIAALLKKREGAVRAQLLRALRQMRKVMDDASP